MKQVYLDVETTGFSSKAGNILQLAAAVYEQGKLVAEYNQYFKPDFPIHPRAEAVHGLSADRLAHAPKFKTQAAKLVELLSGVELIGHNIDFDIRFLNEELRRHDCPEVSTLAARITDTLDLARSRVAAAPNYKLGSLVEHLKLGEQAAQHDAQEDVRLTRRLHENLLQRPALQAPSPAGPVPSPAAPEWAVPLVAPDGETLSAQNSTLRYDDELLAGLIEKLQGHANLNSVHLNARPGVSNKRLALSALAGANAFIEKLLTEPNFKHEFTCAVPPAIAPGSRAAQAYNKDKNRFKTLEIENNDQFQEFGIKNFALGYPILLKRSEHKRNQVIKAPLFIWNLELKKSPQHKDTWVLERNAELPVTVNETLLTYLQKEFGEKLAPPNSAPPEDNLLRPADLLTFCTQLLEQIAPAAGRPGHEAIPPVTALPEKLLENPENFTAPVIAWEGVFSLYAPPKAAIIQRLEALRTTPTRHQLPASFEQPFQKTAVTMVPVDPSKQEIIETLAPKEIKVIQGPPGTGKSQAITAIIDNALANGQKTLVICEKKTALDVVYNNLTQAGLGDYALLINDAKKDRAAVIKKARRVAADTLAHPAPGWSPSTTRAEYETVREQLTQKYALLNQPVIAGLNWRELIAVTQPAPPARLTFPAHGLKLTDAEFNYLAALVTEAQERAARLPAAVEAVFAGAAESPPPHTAPPEQFANFLAALAEFQTQQLPVLEQAYGDIPAAQKALCRHKNLPTVAKPAAAAQRHLTTIAALMRTAAEQGYNNFHRRSLVNFFRRNFFPGAAAGATSFPALHRQYLAECAALENVIATLPPAARAPCPPYRLPREPQARVRPRLAALQKYFTTLVNTCATAEHLQSTAAALHQYDDYFAAPLKKCHDFKDFSGYLQALRARCAQAAAWNNHKKFYPHYQDWQKFCQTRLTSPSSRNLLTALRPQPENTWAAIFYHWYCQQALTNFEQRATAAVQGLEPASTRAAALLKEIQTQQPQDIATHWTIVRRPPVQAAQKYFMGLYNLARNKQYGARNSLKKIIAEDPELFQALFPVILTTPETANLLFGRPPGKFKFVIFDEASQIKLEDSFSALRLGDHKIVVGDEHQLPPVRHFAGDPVPGTPAENSLLEYAADLTDVSKSYLDYHYRSAHPALIEFSNASFYGGNLHMPPPRQTTVPIDFRNIAGEYLDKENNVPKNVNYDEVAEIINILKYELPPAPDGTIPSLGIATTNSKQRNEIIDRLALERETDPAFDRKCRQWERAGFFVKNLENVQGEERDIIILSTVFGKTAAGRFRQNLGNLNKADGYRYINVLVTRAKKKLHVITSIPPEIYRNYDNYLEPDAPNNKRRLFYAYLAYAEAVSAGAAAPAHEILEKMRANTLEEPRQPLVRPAPAILTEVREVLEEFKPVTACLSPGGAVGGYTVDFLLTQGARKLALDYDDKIMEPARLAWVHHQHRKHALQQAGWDYYVIRPGNWRAAPEREIAKIFTQIKEKGGEARPPRPRHQQDY